jgi:hypothetical protein
MGDPAAPPAFPNDGTDSDYLFSTDMSQSPERLELITTRLPRGAVTEPLTLPSPDRTVTDKPSPPTFVLPETDPLPAVTLVLEEPDVAEPLNPEELVTLQPPDPVELELEVDDCASAVADIAITTATASPEARM